MANCTTPSSDTILEKRHGRPRNDPAQYLASLFEAGQGLMLKFAAGSLGTDPTTAFMASSKSFAEMHQNYLEQVGSFWSGMLSVATPAVEAAAPLVKEDKRFASEAWRDDPLFYEDNTPCCSATPRTVRTAFSSTWRRRWRT